MRRLLAGLGHEVLEAASGYEALEVAAAPLSKIDLLITEARVEGPGGLVLARAIAAYHPRASVCVLSADALTDLESLPRHWAWLQKPVPVVDVERVIADLLRRRDEVVAEVA
jgi:two-component system cell cycle sensor histidine kinase/response regulator CckA